YRPAVLLRALDAQIQRVVAAENRIGIGLHVLDRHIDRGARRRERAELVPRDHDVSIVIRLDERGRREAEGPIDDLSEEVTQRDQRRRNQDVAGGQRERGYVYRVHDGRRFQDAGERENLPQRLVPAVRRVGRVALPDRGNDQHRVDTFGQRA